MLNDVATESYEELRAIRHALLCAPGSGRTDRSVVKVGVGNVVVAGRVGDGLQIVVTCDLSESMCRVV